MIGLVLGDTHIGKVIVKKLKSLKKKFIIIDISKNNLFKNESNSIRLSIGQLGKCISVLKENKCRKIIFAGRVERPDFAKVKFDLKAIMNLPQILKATQKGDAYIINYIIKLFEKEGFRIITQSHFNPELVLSKGIKTKTKPKKVHHKDIIIGKNVINNLSLKGITQAAVIINGEVIASENYKGTDYMLKKVTKKIKKSVIGERNGILIKLPKPNQDMRTDIPTIGLKTVKSCISLGLKGIVLKSKRNIFLDVKKSIILLNKNKMFLTVI